MRRADGGGLLERGPGASAGVGASHACSIRLLRQRCLLLLLGLALAPTTGEASVVSRLGSLYFYDAITFDSGVLQRGMVIRGGAASDASSLAAGLELPFFQDFSLQPGYLQHFDYAGPDSHDFSFRVRLPVLETARFGHLNSIQLLYRTRVRFTEQDPLEPQHEAAVAWADGLSGNLLARTGHLQLGAIWRSADATSSPGDPRAGIVLRGAIVVQLYRPPRGIGGKWTVTLSPFEATLFHYGLPWRSGTTGRLELGVACPGVHFTHRRATVSTGLAPVLRLGYADAGMTLDWGAIFGLSVLYRTFLE